MQNYVVSPLNCIIYEIVFPKTYSCTPQVLYMAQLLRCNKTKFGSYFRKQPSQVMLFFIPASAILKRNVHIYYSNQHSYFLK